MFSICPSIRHSFLLARWKGRQPWVSVILASRRMGVAPWRIPCSVNRNSAPHDFDTSKELLGLELGPQPRNSTLPEEKERSWFGPNGQYIRELPCPSCRGRGYTPCSDCGVDRTRVDCSQCSGKGVKTCWQCSGECVIWEESYDERPWEKARSRNQRQHGFVPELVFKSRSGLVSINEPTTSKSWLGLQNHVIDADFPRRQRHHLLQQHLWRRRRNWDRYGGVVERPFFLCLRVDRGLTQRERLHLDGPNTTRVFISTSSKL